MDKLPVGCVEWRAYVKFISGDEPATSANRTLIRVDKCVRHRCVFWGTKQKIPTIFWKQNILN